MEHAERDVVFVTLDSCRYDTAREARTPNLDRLGPLVEAETSGTYTLPAHAAFFNGRLPVPVRSPYRIAGATYRFVWRSEAARVTDAAVAVYTAGPTVMHHYRSRGYLVLGAGGVSFFDPAVPSNWLPGLFDDFRYFGLDQRVGRVLAAAIRDRDTTLSLSHVDTLARRCRAAPRFFLFVNCPSTHFPYCTPANRLTRTTRRLLVEVTRAQYSKWNAEPRGHISPDDVVTLREMQKSALEWADDRLGELFARLRDRQPLVVVCADHGEEFGDGGRFGHGHAHGTVTTVPLWCGVLG